MGSRGADRRDWTKKLERDGKKIPGKEKGKENE